MTTFAELGLDPKVLSAVSDAGYTAPTPIQAGAIPPALEGRDVLGIAQTGTGKTASFVLPMITLLGRGRARARMPRSLVLAPTRELAAQVAENFDTYAKKTKLSKALLIGGVSFKEQDALIDKGVDVLIATPGRLLDHFERGKLLLTGVQIMVVDEADRMLDMGFIPDIERIFQLTPFTRQTLFFSATMAPEIERVTNTFLSAPAKIEVARRASAAESIEQAVICYTASRKDRQAKEKRELLRALIDREGEGCKNAIIFCNRKTEVDIVAKSLKTHGYDAAPIHGDLDQSQRTRTLESFREGKLRFLIASDVAARGLDVPAVSHVFNYDVPSHAEDYVHRIGRTGRAGREGKALTICVPHDEKWLTAIEDLVEKQIPRVDSPLKGGSDDRGKRGRHADEAGASAPERTEERSSARPQRGDRRERNSDRGAERQPDRTADRHGEDRNSHTHERSDSHDRNRQGRSGANNRRGGRDRGYRDEPVVGMGDHMPAFLLRSFKPKSEPEPVTEDQVEESAE
ncbi:DEAD/DEAH box helicase [Rhodovulum kholense]|uniref:DEAD-box ATP-dependent RNA helicase RhpA n=1 Tax=Rhodovulum kholense TaxID=453584 RepID=A0A8E2VKE1_9RHOB|nr:DEAD/DEAH box helicase [Rhodovulum kholense]PTW47125.1 ATP-dependent RNA helicase RhlE [Rhodovulum kholense]